jgi:NADP-dependent 3-hydroxy acid dehydrogenase YdfG
MGPPRRTNRFAVGARDDCGTLLVRRHPATEPFAVSTDETEVASHPALVPLDTEGRVARMDLNGRSIAITGASSGIGEATALACARAGAAVALAARRTDRIDELAGRIESEGGRAIAVETDVTDEDSAYAFVRRAHDELGGLWGLINNAGVMLLGAVEGADTEHWRRMVSVNCLGLLFCTYAAIPAMKEGGGGHIVNVSSVAGRIATMGSAVYNMTKWGVNGFSEGLRQELGHSAIRVTIIEPGAVATELLEHNTPEVQQIAAKRFEGVTPLAAEEIADAILYALTRPQNVSINEVLIRPTTQTR